MIVNIIPAINKELTEFTVTNCNITKPISTINKGIIDIFAISFQKRSISKWIFPL